MLSVSAPIIGTLTVSAQTDEYYHQTFKWSYSDHDYNWSLSIPKALYDSYKKVPDATRTNACLAGYGFVTTTNDYYIRWVAQELNESAGRDGYDEFETVSFILAFVQSLPYTSDLATTGYEEYPRFPVETLVDNGGDCDCKSVLFACVVLIMGYGTVYINPPGHLAVGVLGDDLDGYYFTHENGKYYYCDPVGGGSKIGELPDEYKGVTTNIYDINTPQQYLSDTPQIPLQSTSPNITNILDSGPSPEPTPQSTQTASPTATPEPTPTTSTPLPSIPEFSFTGLAVALLMLTTLASTILFIKRGFRKGWWARPDLNQRSTDYESGALAGLSYGPLDSLTYAVSDGI